MTARKRVMRATASSHPVDGPPGSSLHRHASALRLPRPRPVALSPPHARCPDQPSVAYDFPGSIGVNRVLAASFAPYRRPPGCVVRGDPRSLPAGTGSPRDHRDSKKSSASSGALRIANRSVARAGSPSGSADRFERGETAPRSSEDCAVWRTASWRRILAWAVYHRSHRRSTEGMHNDLPGVVHGTRLVGNGDTRTRRAPDFEIVGCVVNNPARSKAATRARLPLAAMGVLATTDIDEALAGARRARPFGPTGALSVQNTITWRARCARERKWCRPR